MRLFKKDWEYYFNKMTDARRAFFNHGESSWSTKTKYFTKWANSIGKADDYVTLLETTTGDAGKVEKMRNVLQAERGHVTVAAEKIILQELDKKKLADEKAKNKLRR